MKKKEVCPKCRKKMKEYALYKGDEFLSVGTVEEIAKEVGAKPETVMYYGTNAYKRKLAKRKDSKNAKILIKLEDEEC